MREKKKIERIPRRGTGPICSFVFVHIISNLSGTSFTVAAPPPPALLKFFWHQTFAHLLHGVNLNHKGREERGRGQLL